MSTLRRDGWKLRRTDRSDIDVVMRWFPTQDDVTIWGGPSFRYPFTRDTFFEDILWGRIASFCLWDPGGDLVAFGQLYDRDGRIHLARLVVAPDERGKGTGKRLIELLVHAGRDLFSRDEISLFVFRDNRPAFECYRSLGFRIQDYPKDMPHADVCYYLTRSALTEE